MRSERRSTRDGFVKVDVRLPPGLYSQIEDITDQYFVNRSEAIRAAIREFDGIDDNRCLDCGKEFATKRALWGHWGASDCERRGRK